MHARQQDDIGNLEPVVEEDIPSDVGEHAVSRGPALRNHYAVAAVGEMVTQSLSPRSANLLRTKMSRVLAHHLCLLEDLGFGRVVEAVVEPPVSLMETTPAFDKDGVSVEQARRLLFAAKLADTVEAMVEENSASDDIVMRARAHANRCHAQLREFRCNPGGELCIAAASDPAVVSTTSL